MIRHRSEWIHEDKERKRYRRGNDTTGVRGYSIKGCTRGDETLVFKRY